jgi:hypothetical protein
VLVSRCCSPETRALRVESPIADADADADADAATPMPAPQFCFRRSVSADQFLLISFC